MKTLLAISSASASENSALQKVEMNFCIDTRSFSSISYQRWRMIWSVAGSP
jgi:hypothetical protein